MFNFYPYGTWGNDPKWRAYIFQIGFKPPTTKQEKEMMNIAVSFVNDVSMFGSVHVTPSWFVYVVFSQMVDIPKSLWNWTASLHNSMTSSNNGNSFIGSIYGEVGPAPVQALPTSSWRPAARFRSHRQAWFHFVGWYCTIIKEVTHPFPISLGLSSPPYKSPPFWWRSPSTY